MNRFLIIIIKGMNTVDGLRDSSKLIQDKIIKTKRKDMGLAIYKDDDEGEKLIVTEKEKY